VPDSNEVGYVILDGNEFSLGRDGTWHAIPFEKAYIHPRLKLLTIYDTFLRLEGDSSRLTIKELTIQEAVSKDGKTKEHSDYRLPFEAVLKSFTSSAESFVGCNRLTA
jgi:hypothetical protein